MEYYSALRKEEIVQFATTLMDLESIMLSEISHREKDKNLMVSYVESKKKNKLSPKLVEGRK